MREVYACSKYAQAYMMERDGVQHIDSQSVNDACSEEDEAVHAQFDEKMSQEVTKTLHVDNIKDIKKKRLVEFYTMSSFDSGNKADGRKSKIKMLKIDVQCAMYWQKEASAPSVQQEFVEHYAHDAVKERRIALHVTKARTQTEKGYNTLRNSVLKPTKDMLFCKNPNFVPAAVSKSLLPKAHEEVRQRWGSECILMHTTIPVDEWAQTLRDTAWIDEYETCHLIEHPYTHLLVPDLLYGKKQCSHRLQDAGTRKSAPKRKIGETGSTERVLAYQKHAKRVHEKIERRAYSFMQ